MAQDYFPGRRFTVGSVQGFDPKWYLSHRGDVVGGWQNWSNDQSSVDWRDYVRANPELDSAWRSGIGIHPAGAGYAGSGAFIAGNPQGAGKPTRWDWGYQHWQHHGNRQQAGKQRILPKIVGGRISPSVTRNIWTGPSMSKEDEKNAFAAWHWETKGQYEGGLGRFRNESEWYNSPEEVNRRQADRDAREAMMRQQMDDAEMQRLNTQAESRESGRLADLRGGRADTLGSSGSATLKGKGLESSKNKRGGGRGTNQFRRPYGTSSLNIASAGLTTPNSNQGK